jgi:hypothetical protein
MPIVAGATAVALWAILVCGLFFHHSAFPEVLGRFSRGYLLGLVLVAAATPLVFFAARALATPTRIPRPGAPDLVAGPALKIAVSAGALLLGLAIAQALPTPRRDTGFRYDPHPFLQAVPRPDPARGVNSRGFRGREAAVPKPAGLVRVVLLGGSTSFDPDLDFADSYGARLEEALNTALAPRRADVQVAAVPGFNTEHDLIRYTADAADLEPDVVLVMEAVNDLYACAENADGFRRDYGHLRGLRQAHAPGWRDRTGLLSAASWFLHIVLFSDFRPVPALELDGREPDPGPLVRNLSAIVAVARSRDQAPVLCTQPHRFRLALPEAERLRGDAALRNFRNGIPLPGFRWFSRNMAVFNVEVRSLAAREGVPLLDFERLVPPRPDLFLDEVHVTGVGARLEAREAARLLKSVLAERSAAP